MPAQPMNLRWPGATAAVDPRGVVSLRLDADEQPLRLAFAADPNLVPVLADEDTVEHEGAVDGLSVSQRITSADQLQLRWVLTAEKSAALPELELTIPAGHRAWLWASGADGLLAILPDVGSGPVLLLHAVQAGLWDGGQAADDRRLRLAFTPQPLAPGDRLEVVWRAVVLPDLLTATGLLPAWYEPLRVLVGEDWVAPLADLGFDAPPSVEVEYPDEALAVQLKAPPGAHRLRVHSRHGVTEVELEVAPALGDLLGEVAERVLAADLPLDSAAALIVHRAVLAGVLPWQPRIEDELDRFDWTSRRDPLAIAFGSERALAEGEREMAREAVRQLVALPASAPVARVRSVVWVAAAALGVDTAPLLVGAGADGLANDLLLARRSAGSVAGLAAAINQLGATLPGRPVGIELTEQAQLVGLLESCPEGWPEAALAGATAQAARCHLLARYAAGEVLDPAPLAWLLVSS